MTGIEKKKSFIINTVYAAILIALFYLFFKYALGTVFPIICSLIIAMVLQKPVNFLCKKTPLKRGIVSTFLVLISFLFVLLFFHLIFLLLNYKYQFQIFF